MKIERRHQMSMIGFLVLFTAVTVNSEASDLKDGLHFILLSVAVPFTSLILLNIANYFDSFLRYVVAGGFLASYAYTIFMLTYSTVVILTHGSLQEQTLMGMPVNELYCLAAGGLLGLLIGAGRTWYKTRTA